MFDLKIITEALVAHSQDRSTIQLRIPISPDRSTIQHNNLILIQMCEP